MRRFRASCRVVVIVSIYVSVLFTAAIQSVVWQGTCWSLLGMLILAWCAGRWRGHLFQLWQHIKRDWDDIHIHHISGTQFEWNASGGPMRFLLWLELHGMAIVCNIV